MDPILSSTLSYLIIIALTFVSMNELRKKDIWVISKNGDLIALTFIMIMSLILPPYWIVFSMLWLIVMIGASMRTKEGWWRPIFWLVIFTNLMIVSKANLPMWW
jgi:hypothetical protein